MRPLAALLLVLAAPLAAQPAADLSEYREAADRIIEAMATPFAIEGHRITLGASVGIAMAPADGETSDRLMKNAQLALHRAKSEGRSSYHFFESGMDAAIQQRREIEAGLRQALERQELRLMYQPLLGLKQDRVVCCEALLRWDHPERGAVSPMEFIPVAEETGLINAIGLWVLRQACEDAVGWNDITLGVTLAGDLNPESGFVHADSTGHGPLMLVKKNCK